MDIQDKIIALLQGDLKKDSEVADLMQDLVNSSEKRSTFLAQLSLSHEIDNFVSSISPSMDQMQVVLQRVSEYEKNINKLPVEYAQKPKVIPKKIFIPLLALLIGLFVGRWTNSDIGEKNAEINNGNMRRQQRDRSGELNSRPENTLLEKNGQFLEGAYAGNKKFSNTSSQVELIDPDDEEFVIVAPNGKERFISGSIIPLVWKTGKVKSPVDVEFSKDGGATWSSIDNNITGEKYLWTVPTDYSGNECLIRVRRSGDPEIALKKVFRAHETGGNAIDYSPDGRLLATAAHDTLIIWDVSSGKMKSMLTEHRQSIILVRFSPDGKRVVTGSIDSTAIIWDVATGSVEAVLQGERGRIWPVDFNPDGTEIATGNDDGSITLWETRTGTKITTFHVHNEAIRYLQFSQNGKKIIASSTDRSASIIDASTGEVIRYFTHFDDGAKEGRNVIVNGIQLVANDSVAVTCGYDGNVKYWNVESGELIRVRQYHSGKGVSEIQVSPDGKIMISMGYDGTAKIIDPRTGIVLAGLQLDSFPIIRSSFSPDGRSVALMHADGNVSIWILPLPVLDVSDSFWSIEPCGVAEPELN